MVYASLFLAALSLVAPAFSAPQSAKRFVDYTVHHERTEVPSLWTRVEASSASASDRRRSLASRDSILPVRINLAQRNVERAHDILMDIADPDSPRYGEHMSPEDVAELFAPTEDSIDDVLAWLSDAGHDVSRSQNYDHFKGAVTVKMRLGEAEDLLRTTYDLYQHQSSETPHVACTSYSVPSSISHHIDFITPTTDFDLHVPRNKRSVPSHGSRLGGGSIISPKIGPALDSLETHDATGTTTCDTAITPACLRAMYGINYTPTKNLANGLGIVEYTPQSYIPTDLDKFFKSYAPTLAAHRPLNRSIDGGVILTDKADQSENNNGESNLDLEYAMAIVGPTQAVNLYQTGDVVQSGSFNTFLDALDSSYCSGDDTSQDPVYPDTSSGGYKGNSCGLYRNVLPKVVSTSYGYNEVDLSTAYEKRQCNEYMKLGLLGTTFVFSSGDYGVAGNGGDCLDPKTGNSVQGGSAFNPAFPSTCPYVLSVGATQLAKGSTTSSAEQASQTVIYSGGGFSNRFTMPTYQSTAVASYLKNHKPTYNSTVWNSSGKSRGYPDIAANGANYVVAIDGSFTLIYGTSAAAPVVASMLALINNARAAKGKKSIGFVNPTLYKNPGAFRDITKGGNQGCGTKGYTSVAGWDPVTGLGTPKFQSLMTLFMAMP